jgi:hypothetical protein
MMLLVCFVFSYNCGEWDGRCGGMNGRWMRNKEIDRWMRNEDWLKEKANMGIVLLASVAWARHACGLPPAKMRRTRRYWG